MTDRSHPTPAVDVPPAEERPGSELGNTPLFRDEAVQEHLRQQGRDGDVVRIAPEWAGAASWFLAVALAGILAFVVFGKTHRYATGPAVVRLVGQIELSSTVPGVVDSVHVLTGDRVRRGQLLIQFRSEDERAQFDKLRVDFDHALIEMLRNPDDSALQAAVGRLRAEMELARSRVEQRVLRATADGIVYDVRVRPGQALGPGEPAVSLVRAGQTYELVALIPGRFGPLMHPRQLLRFRITGYAHAEIVVPITTLGDGVVGPNEVRRILGQELGDAITIREPVLPVRASLQPTFQADDTVYPLCNGLQGSAEVLVSEERLVYSLLPWLRSLNERRRG